MKKRVITSVALLFLLLDLSAKSISEATAKIVGQNFISTRLVSAGSKIKSGLSLVYKGTDETSLVVYYVFNSSNGFVIISADDNAIPILAYSDEGTFNPNNLGPNTKDVLQNYSGQISHVAKNNIKPLAKITSNWYGYINGTSVAYKTEATSVAPLVKTKWGQGGYYKTSCPGGSVTGCVATAMGQIMKYWNGPSLGIGSHTYNHATYGTLSVNFGSSSYDWCSMPNQVSSTNSSVATLLYHCGVSVDMNYSPTGSGAYVIGAGATAETAFKTYFGYKSSIQGLSRGYYTDAAWISMLKSNLDGGKPVLYAGYDANSAGHAFVCDGYDANDLFHFNYGWDGSSDGYYAVNGIVNGYNNNQNAVMGIEPINRVVGYGEYSAPKITDHSVSGDFDRDGKEDDIAAFYEYGTFTTSLHVWKSNGSAFTYQGDNGWWNGTSYQASKIVGMVAGDFNRDGYKDDIAVFYDYGNFKTTIHVWTSTGSSFNSPATAGWYTNNGYDATKIKGRVVSGDFDRDGYKDDIAAFYDYGTWSTNIHVWQSTGSSFAGPSTAGWWSSTAYAPSKITGRVISGDFNSDGVKDNIAAFYDYPSFSTAIHVWKSNVTSFTYAGDNGMWKVCGVGTLKKSEEDDAVDEAKAIIAENIKIYPNPSTGVVSLKTEFTNCKVEVFNALGQQVCCFSAGMNEISNFDLSNQSKGLYFIKVSDGKISSCVKLILQ